MLAVPTQIGRVGLKARIFWYSEHPVTAYQPAEIIRDPVRGKNDPEAIAEGHQAAVEQPVRGACQCYAVSDGIRTIGFHGTDVRSLDFGAAATVDEA